MVRSKWFLILALIAVVVGGCTNKADKTMAGLDRMAHPELVANLLPDGTVTKQFIAYDLSAGNADGNFVTAFTKYVEPNNECVFFDEYGPGCLYRQQVNFWWELADKTSNNALFGKARFRYYFDNEKTPRIDMTADELFGAKTSPFTFPLSLKDGAINIPGRPQWGNRFANTYYPLPFEKRLKVTITPPSDWSKRGCAWYQFTYLAYPTADGVKTWKGPTQDSRAVRKQWSNLGSDPKPTQGNAKFDSKCTIQPGQTSTVFDHKGQGSIAALKFKMEPFNQDTFFNTNILISWDDQMTPSVSLPIGYLFGGGGINYTVAPQIAKKTLKTLFYGFDCNEHTFYSYWPMPFWSNATIKIQNLGRTPITFDSNIEMKADTRFYSKKNAGYFCAKRTVDHDANGMTFFCHAFNENGRGQVAGISFYTEGYAMDGDEFTYIDNSRTPQIHGNGTEDDHNQGWGGSDYQCPLWGGLVNGYQGAYRIYMNEPYIFYDNIHINYEYSKADPIFIKFGKTHSKTDIVIFYYKSPLNKGLKLTDEVNVGNEASERSHNYRVSLQTWEKTVTSCYDGYEQKPDYDCLTDSGRAFNGFSEFTVALDPHNNGVKLRKRISRFENGVQTAIVYVDGKKVTERPWHIVQPSSAPADQAWQDCDFQIPASYTHGKKSVEIRLEYAGSTKGEINEFYYWVYCLQK